MAELNGNYIEHCHWLLALPPKCHLHPFVQQPFMARNSFGVRKLTADPNANYIEHCHWLLALPLSVMTTHSFSSRPGRVILSGYANCDRRAERELYRTLSLAACASAKCHLHPFAQQSFRALNSFGVGKL